MYRSGIALVSALPFIAAMRADKKGSSSLPLVQEILRYLIAHPHAKDTIDGIMAWWCPKTGVERGKGEVQEILDLLVAKGWLTKRETRPVQTIYGMNSDRIEEIERFLQNPQDWPMSSERTTG